MSPQLSSTLLQPSTSASAPILAPQQETTPDASPPPAQQAACYQTKNKLNAWTTIQVLDMTFGERLTDRRKQQRISQPELAQQLDLHKKVPARYERDQAKPSIDVAAKIAKAMGVSLDYLSGNVEADVDEEVVKRVQSIQGVPRAEKDLIRRTAGALVRDAKSRPACLAV